MTRPASRRVSPVSAALARDRLGVPSVVFFVLSGVAPLTVAAGVVTTAYAVTGLTGIPAAFIVVALVLGLFSVGYVAMARHITNAGAFYAFVSRGLGRPVGVGAALMAVVAYNLLQVGLYGAFGPTAAAFAETYFDVTAPWWIWSLGAWAIVTVLGLMRVDLNGKVLAVLLSAEIAVLLVLTVTGLLNPAPGGYSLATLSPANLFPDTVNGAGVGPLLVIAVLGYVGFESSAVFSEESKHPRRTVPVATYFSLAMIAVVYAGASWALAVAYGDNEVAGVAQKNLENPPEMLFALSGGLVADVARTLFLTSVFAAMLAFHNAVGRYMFALGREAVLPRMLGQTGRNNAPRTASVVQSSLGLTTIVLFAVLGWQPVVHLFFWGGITGGLGVLLLVTITSVAVIGFFARDRHGESAWRRIVAPGLASIALLAMVWLALDNFSGLLNVAPGSLPARLLPAVYAAAVVLGIGWALVLRSTRPEVYAAIGLGANVATGEAARDERFGAASSSGRLG